MNTVSIGIFGRRNVGKSSLINFIAGQDVAIVSENPGTTTDPVRKRIEIFGLGPCVLIDTAGIDDDGELGRKRVAKTEEVVPQIDVAVLMFSRDDFGAPEEDMMSLLRRYDLPVVLVHGKSDVSRTGDVLLQDIRNRYGMRPLEFSALESEDGRGVMLDALLDSIKANAVSAAERFSEKPMFDGIVSAGQHVLLVCPIDSEAPTGRLILPQVNAIRNLLDIGAGQAFAEVAAGIPSQMPMTSFSMLLARSKGCFKEYCAGTPMIDRLKDGDRVLILESCSHHSSCDDIGRVKIPAMMRNRTGKALTFDVVGGLDRIGRPMSDYALVLQCGGCMITRRQLYSRLLPAIESGVPVTNYGMAISFMKGIYERALKPLVK